MTKKTITKKELIYYLIALFALPLSILFIANIEDIFPKDGIRINSSSNQLVGQNYETVVSKLESRGFTDIKLVILDDLIFGWFTKDGEVEEVAINGTTKFEESARFPADAKIIVTYHTFPEKDPDTIDGFPKEYAMRAAVVAFTNRYATDIFEEDGNTVNIDLLHSYSDLSGYFLHVVSEGTWTVKDDDTWHVDHLELRVDVYNTILDVNIDVTYDGELYFITNLSGKAPSYPDISVFEKESDFSLYFIVKPELIKDDR